MIKKRLRIMGEEEIEETLSYLSHAIIGNVPIEELALIGIRTRGEHLAARIKKIIDKVSSFSTPIGILDITLYRDDLTLIAPQPIVRKTEIPFDITGKAIVLIDDVLFTGRTVRAAMDALTDLGRPGRIQLAVLVDRGGRELPIQADYVGKKAIISHTEMIEVKLKEADGYDEAVIATRSKP
jgi:pyrimidine operon attenuation protein/uracil phosphoribosyltransferase